MKWNTSIGYWNSRSLLHYAPLRAPLFHQAHIVGHILGIGNDHWSEILTNEGSVAGGGHSIRLRLFLEGVGVVEHGSSPQGQILVEVEASLIVHSKFLGIIAGVGLHYIRHIVETKIVHFSPGLHKGVPGRHQETVGPFELAQNTRRSSWFASRAERGVFRHLGGRLQ